MTVIVTSKEEMQSTIESAVASVLEKYGIIKQDENLPRFLKVPQLAKLTGYSVNTINIKNSRKEIPGAKKIAGRVLFDTQVILDWIESGAVKTKKERLDEMDKDFSERLKRR